MPFSISRKIVAEAVGTAFLLAIVVGSGIMGETHADGSVAVALLGNTIATGAGLVILILILGPISGAHFNPAVTLSFLMRGEISAKLAGFYVVIQIIAGLVGVTIAHIMFEMPIAQYSTNIRAGAGQITSEAVATFGLVLTILGCVRFRQEAVPYAVGLYITAGYWFTSSTSFANPAVTIARAFTDSFAGIRPIDAPAFIIAQLIAAALATWLAHWLFEPTSALYTPSDDRPTEPIQSAR